MQFRQAVALLFPGPKLARATELSDADHDHSSIRELKGFDLDLVGGDLPHVVITSASGEVVSEVPLSNVASYLQGELKHVQEARLTRETKEREERTARDAKERESKRGKR